MKCFCTCLALRVVVTKLMYHNINQAFPIFQHATLRRARNSNGTIYMYHHHRCPYFIYFVMF